MPTPSVVPVSKICSVCLRTHAVGLSSYSPVNGMSDLNARGYGSIRSVEDDLRLALTAAIKARDRVAVSALRSALGALGNATAVETEITPEAGAIAGGVTGVGAAEVERRALTPDEERAIVQAEIDEREAAATLVVPEAAVRLRAEAAVLRARLLSAGPPDRA